MKNIRPSLFTAALAALLLTGCVTEAPLPEGERVPINFSSWTKPSTEVSVPVTNTNDVGNRAVVADEKKPGPVVPVVVKDDEPVPVRTRAVPAAAPVPAPAPDPQPAPEEKPAEKTVAEVLDAPVALTPSPAEPEVVRVEDDPAQADARQGGAK